MTAVRGRRLPQHRWTIAPSFATLLVGFALILGSVTAFASDFALKQKFAVGDDVGCDCLTYDKGANRLFI